MFDHLQKFQYRADIDGLRAVAVIGVVLFHAGLGVSGGYVGVDVFFVISGFLITSLILRDLNRGDFSMLAFWERRARRIFPALAVVVIATLIAGWFLMLSFGYQVLGQSTVALTVFASNIQFWRTSGYFDPAAEENPLLHTWSLSAEEQFYLIVPLFLWLLFALRAQKWLIMALGAGVVASLALSAYWTNHDPKGAFYLLPSRAWELGAGSLMALARPIPNAHLRGSLGWLGMALILYGFFAYDANTVFPGLAAIPPVLGTVLLIWSGMSGDSENPLRGMNRLLAAKVLVAIGLLSYSFYLWHWPFFAFHRYLFSHAPGPLLAMGYILIALGLSALSLRYIERPFRQGNIARKRSSIFLIVGLVSSLTITAGMALWQSRGLPWRLPEEVAKFDAVKGDFFHQNSRVFIDEDKTLVRLGAEDKPCRLAVLGDSHAGVLLSMFDQICREHDIAALAATRGRHAPVLEWSGVDPSSATHARKVHFNKGVMSHVRDLAQSGELRQVVLAFRWSYYLVGASREADEPKPLEGFEDALLTTIHELEDLGLRVAVLLEVPSFEEHVPKAVALHHWHGFALPHTTRQEHLARVEPYNALIERIRRDAPFVRLIDASPYLFSEDGDVEYIDEKGELLYRDEHHLTEYGTMRLKPLFEDVLFK